MKKFIVLSALLVISQPLWAMDYSNTNDTIRTTGNVAIGTTSTGNKLTVSGYVGIGTTSPSSVYLSTKAPDGGMLIEGNVGIGTTEPGEKLEVSGNIKLFGASPTYKVTNVVAPTAASDVATKGYVDAAVDTCASGTATVADIRYATTADIDCDNLAEVGTMPNTEWTATVSDIKSGAKAGGSAATTITGIMPTQTLSAANQTVNAGYYEATTLSAVDPDLTVGNVKTGVTIFGFTGTAGAHELPDTGQEGTYTATFGEDHDYQPAGSQPSYTDNADGTITDNQTGLMWVKQPELIIPGAAGVHSTNQIQTARGNWATSTAYALADLAYAIETEISAATVTNSTTTVTSNTADTFTADDVGRYLVVTGYNTVRIVGYTSGTVVTTAVAPTNGVTAATFSINSYYVCATAHTSGTFATDLAAGKWRETIWTASAANLTTPSTMTWENSLTKSEALVYAGYSDWRLPNSRELMSIVDYGESSPAVHKTASTPTYFKNTISTSYYWSSTTIASDTGNAWAVYFSSGRVDGSAKATSYYVRCVRGGQ